jgi:flagellar assembly factor FliW
MSSEVFVFAVMTVIMNICHITVNFTGYAAILLCDE